MRYPELRISKALSLFALLLVASLALSFLTPTGLLGSLTMLGLQAAIAVQAIGLMALRRPATVVLLAFGLGVAFALLTLGFYLAALASWPPLAYLVVPVVMTGGVLVTQLRLPSKGTRPISTGKAKVSDSWALIGALLAFAASAILNRFQFVKYGFPWAPDPSSIHVDNIGHQLVANAVSTTGLDSGGYMASWPIRYHLLAYLFAGSVENDFDLEAFTGIVFLTPWISLVLMALGLAAVMRLTTSSRFLLAIAPLVAMQGFYLGSALGVNVNWDSGSQMLSSGLLLAAVAMVLWQRSGGVKPAAFYPIILIFSFAIAGVKISAGIIFISALIGVLAWDLFRRRSASQSFGALTVAGLGAGLAYIALMSGQESSGQLVFQPFALFTTAGNSGAVNVDGVQMLLSIAPSWLPLFLSGRYLSENGRSLLAVARAVALAALAPLLLLVPVMPNTGWFATTATLIILPTSLLVATSHVRAQVDDRLQRRRLTISMVAVTAILTALWPVLGLLRFGLLTAQTLFYLSAFALSAILCFSVWSSLDLRRWVSVLALVGSLSPLMVLVGNGVLDRVFPPQTRTTATSGESEITSPSGGSTDAVSSIPAEETTPNENPTIPAGNVVALSPGASLEDLTWLAKNRLQPYFSFEPYATALGPIGSAEEYQRRVALWDLYIQDPSNREGLCIDGVDFVLMDPSNPNASAPESRLRPLDCASAFG